MIKGKGRSKLRNLGSDKVIFELTFLNDKKWPAPSNSEVRVFQIEEIARAKGWDQLSGLENRGEVGVTAAKCQRGCIRVSGRTRRCRALWVMGVSLDFIQRAMGSC